MNEKNTWIKWSAFLAALVLLFSGYRAFFPVELQKLSLPTKVSGEGM